MALFIHTVGSILSQVAPGAFFIQKALALGDIGDITDGVFSGCGSGCLILRSHHFTASTLDGRVAVSVAVFDGFHHCKTFTRF